MDDVLHVILPVRDVVLGAPQRALDVHDLRPLVPADAGRDQAVARLDRREGVDVRNALYGVLHALAPCSLGMTGQGPSVRYHRWGLLLGTT
ncbi:hypothetical protein TU94_28280 [Streptomyces cyaneogriseus subsp. noncyanogenus]|uniref:Uncharacterized protein n=1 Tax=Streptomyces cyaneogriseus subsp. noncyanogenus TaxID=477245 RepID=A0A0C5G441_9ACTN|nr:hypothetical protein TU94_28280 [Streptomyces cyaneogriseus subsp. noncyanogenus]